MRNASWLLVLSLPRPNRPCAITASRKLGGYTVPSLLARASSCFAVTALPALTSDINAIDRAKRTHQTVPNVAAYSDPAIQFDELLQAFGTQLAHTVPMSVSPTMRLVWTPYKTKAWRRRSQTSCPDVAERAPHAVVVLTISKQDHAVREYLLDREWRAKDAVGLQVEKLAPDQATFAH